MPRTQGSSSALTAALNRTTIGASMPAVTLPEGQNVQPGPIGALLLMIGEYDRLVQEESPDKKEKFILEAKMGSSVPSLKTLGIFELFSPEEWIQGSSPGRRYIGELALKDSSSEELRTNRIDSVCSTRR